MRALALLGALVGLTGCGAVIDPVPPMGRPCAVDTDCVPNDCCGAGTGAVHVQDAPDCTTVRCSGTCPLNQVGCGCGLPICRNSQCTVAVSTDPGC